MIYRIFWLFIIIPTLHFSQTNSDFEKIQKYISDKNYAQVFLELNVLTQKNPNDHNIYRNYAEVLLSLNQHDQALTSIRHAIKLSQNNPSNHLIAGNIYRSQQNYAEAKKEYEAAIRLNPNMGEAYTEFSLLHLQYKYTIDAEKLAQLAYHYNPDSWQNIILRARIAQHKNNYNDAQKLLLEGIQKFPYNENLLDAFGEFYLENKEFEKAIVLLEEANTRFGESLYRNQLIADTAYRQEKNDLALKYYEKIDLKQKELALFQSSEIKWKLANLYKRYNQVNKFQQYLQNALELDPLNQLYLSSFTQYLLSTSNTDAKQSLALFLEKQAHTQRKIGISLYYLNLLQKIIRLTPSNNRVRAQLIDFAKIKKNEYQIQQLLEESLVQETGNKSLKKIVDLRNHLNSSKRLNYEKRRIYQYSNKIFITYNNCSLEEEIKSELQQLEYFFPHLINTVELENSFASQSRTMFENNNIFNMATVLSFDKNNSTMNIKIFDKRGVLLSDTTQAFYRASFIQNLIDLYQKIDSLLPRIGFISQREPNSHFRINLGSSDKLTINSYVAIVDQNFNPLTTAQVLSVDTYESRIRQIQPSGIIDLETTMIIPIEYVPSLQTKENTPTPSQNLIKNIIEVSQIKISRNVTL